MQRGTTAATPSSTCCEVCAEEFSNDVKGRVPKLISCGHSFCESCLTQLEKKNRVTEEKYVPSRRPAAGLVMLQETLYSKVTAYTEQYEITCPKCKEKTVSDKPCNSLPKNYVYLDLVSEVVECQKNQLNRCKKHPNYVLDMFCHDEEPEEQNVCLYCAIYGDHKGHNVSTLSGFAERQRTKIKEQIDFLENIIHDYEKLRGDLEARIREATENAEDIRKYVVSKFESVKSEITKILNNKLEAVLDQLGKYDGVQMSLFESARNSLNTKEFKAIQTRAKTFLREADECTIAKENCLLREMQAKIDETQKHYLCTQHMYEARVDNADHIVGIVNDLADSWVCSVQETIEASHEYTSTVIGRRSVTYADGSNTSVQSKTSVQNAFDRIECKKIFDK